MSEKKIPFISWTDGTLNSEKNIGKVQRMSRSYIIKRAAAFVASSTASRQAQIAYGADEKKCFISYLTVDIQKYLQKKTEYGGRELLYVGSLIQRKGLDLLFPALAQTREDICLTIVGEGQEKEALMEQAKSLGSHPASAFWDMLRENRCGSFTIMQMYLSCRPEKIALDW